MFSYVEGILAQQSVILEGQEGFGFFEPSAFALGKGTDVGGEGNLLFSRSHSEEGLETGLVSFRPREEGGEESYRNGVLPEVGSGVLPVEGGNLGVLPREVAGVGVLPEAVGAVWAESVASDTFSAVSVKSSESRESKKWRDLSGEGMFSRGAGFSTGEENLPLSVAGSSATLGQGTLETSSTLFGDKLGREFVAQGEILSRGKETIPMAETGLSRGDFAVMEEGTEGVLRDSVALLERQILEMRVENPLVTRQDFLISGEETRESVREMGREMVYQAGDGSVLPQEGWGGTVAPLFGETGTRESLGTARTAVLPFVGEKEVLPSMVGGVAEGGEFEDRGQGLLSQIRWLDRVQSGKVRLEREVLQSPVRAEGIALGERWRETAAVSVEDFDRAVARDARRYDGI